MSVAAVLACAVASGGEWSGQDIDPKARPSGTAYTIGRYDWKLGLVEQDFGLFENAQIGTVAALWALQVANGHAKVDAIRTKRLFTTARTNRWPVHFELRGSGWPGTAGSHCGLMRRS